MAGSPPQIRPRLVQTVFNQQKLAKLADWLELKRPDRLRVHVIRVQLLLNAGLSEHKSEEHVVFPH